MNWNHSWESVTINNSTGLDNVSQNSCPRNWTWISEHDLIWKQHLYICNSLSWDEIILDQNGPQSSDRCSYNKAMWKHRDTHTQGRGDQQDQSLEWGSYKPRKEHQGLLGAPRIWKKLGQTFHYTAFSGGHRIQLKPWFQTSRLPNCKIKHF